MEFVAKLVNEHSISSFEKGRFRVLSFNLCVLHSPEQNELLVELVTGLSKTTHGSWQKNNSEVRRRKNYLSKLSLANFSVLKKCESIKSEPSFRIKKVGRTDNLHNFKGIFVKFSLKTGRI